MDAHMRRREEDVKKLRSLAEEYSGSIDVVAVSGNPLSRIRVRLTVPTASNNKYPNEVKPESDVSIELNSSYPLRPPQVSITSSVWNPNIFHNGIICLGTKWIPTQGLDLLVLRVMGILAFDPLIINLSSPANAEAASWYKRRKIEYPQSFPTVNLQSLKRSLEAPKIVWKDVGRPKLEERVIVTCKNCQSQLRVIKGKVGHVRCPKCKLVFEIT